MLKLFSRLLKFRAMNQRAVGYRRLLWAEPLEERALLSATRFAVIGDYGLAGQPEADVANLVKSWNPDVVLTVGDNNYQTGQASTIDANIGQYYHSFISPYVGSYGAGAATNSFFPVLGSHDWGDTYPNPTGDQPFLDYFSLPGNERYYTFTQGPVQFFALDSNGNEPDGATATSVQGQWLQAQLAASTATYKIVYDFDPPYSSSTSFANVDSRWPYQAWGATAVISGHAHNYERLLEDNNFPYFINGLGGEPEIIQFNTPVPGSQIQYNADFGAMLVNADSNQIQFQFITRTGQVIDTYSIPAPAAQPGAASSLRVSGFPSPIQAGVPGNFTVTALDAIGNTATGYLGTVHLTSSDIQAGLPADYTFTAADAGVHTFSATLKTAGSQSLIATDTGTGTITGNEPITVQPAAAGSLRLAGFPSPIQAGVTGNFTVTAVDAFGNKAPTYTGTIHFTSSDGLAALPADYTFVPADGGAHTFSATLMTLTSQSLIATDIATSSITGSQTITVQAAVGSLLVAGFPSPIQAGVAGNFTITALDAFGKTATTYTGTIHFSSSDGHAVLPADYTFTPADGGVHTFSATLTTTGNQSLIATDIATSAIAGTQTIMVQLAASGLLVAGFPSPVQAGVPRALTITALDTLGNIATGYRGTIHFSSTDSKALLPANYTFTAADGGVHTFSATLKTAGTQSVTATDTATSSITSTATTTVQPAAASSLRLAGFPSPTQAGAAGNFTITVLDAYGNIASGYRGTVHFSSTDSKALLPANYTFTAADGGVHTFSATLKTAGGQFLTATDTATSSITGAQAIIVQPAASSLRLVGFPSPIQAGTAGNFIITALDAFGNAVTGYRGTIHFTSSDPQAILPANYTFTAADGGAHTFSAMLKTAGSQSLTATDTATSTIAGTQKITVQPAAARGLRVVGFPSPIQAGVVGIFTVTALDAFGNIVTGYRGTVHFSSSDNKAVLPANYTFTAGDGGVHTFSATLKTAGTQSLNVTDVLTSSIAGTETVKVQTAGASNSSVATTVTSTASTTVSPSSTTTSTTTTTSSTAGTQTVSTLMVKRPGSP